MDSSRRASRQPLNADAKRPRLAAAVICLLPARNAAEHLAEWFASVSRFADAVVALDDGSTDATAEILATHPLVRILLRNPQRPDYRGWDDSRNRNRLLAAAATLAPDWIISIDADEILPEDEGRALRRFILEQAVPGVAYGFPRYRMIDGLDRFDRHDSRVVRLFGYRPGQVFPRERLHFMPVPTSIPPARWLVTDIRIQHLGGLTGERRRARLLKYAQADPDRRWEQGNDYADTPPGEPITWARRRRAQPVIVEAPFLEQSTGDHELALDGPVLSVLLIVREETIEEMAAVFGAVERHRCSQPVEIVVVALGTEVADDLARMLPRATVIRLEPRSTPARCRNVGLRVAQGDYLVCFDGPVELAPGALDALISAHDAGNAVVTGAVFNGTRSAPGWAAYFDGAVRASFAREPLVALGGFDEALGERAEAGAGRRLLAQGHHARHTALLAFESRTDLESVRDYMADRFATGRIGSPPGAGRWRTLHDGQPEGRRALRRVAHLLVGGWTAALIGDAGRRIRH